MPNLIISRENDGTYIVWNKGHFVDFQVRFETEQLALQFVTDFTFKFFSSRVY